MKNKILLLVLCSFVISNEWVNIDSNNPKTPEVDILFSNIDITEIEFTIPGFYLNPKNINDEIEIIKQRINNNLPTFGICFGSQLIAKAMGSDVYFNDKKEIGWKPIELSNFGLFW